MTSRIETPDVETCIALVASGMSIALVLAVMLAFDPPPAVPDKGVARG